MSATLDLALLTDYLTPAQRVAVTEPPLPVRFSATQSLSSSEAGRLILSGRVRADEHGADLGGRVYPSGH
jgi:hypothetical protein